MPFLDLIQKKSPRLLINVEGKVVEKYEYFMEFLSCNRDALGAIAEIEQHYYGGNPLSLGAVKSHFVELTAATRTLVEALNGVSGGRYANLTGVYDRLYEEIARNFAPEPAAPAGELILPLEALTLEKVFSAGAKATNLALMHNYLGAPIPPGFVITAQAFELFLQETGLAEPIQEIIARVSPDSPEDLEEKSQVIRKMILQAQVPVALAAEILKAYQDLEKKSRMDVRLAMRSSAVGEDTEASFAGQYVTELNVTRDRLFEAYKTVLAGKYSPRAIVYRMRYGLEDRDTRMCVAGIAMVNSRSSGVLYTVDPSRPDSNLVKINSLWGLGEQLVSGEASPDEFYVDKKTGEMAHRVIGKKEHRLVNREEGGLCLEEVPEAEKTLPSLDDDQVLALARYGLKLEEYFQGPQDIEWAVDPQGNLYFLQSRPLGLTQAESEKEALPQDFPGHPALLSGGKMASPGIAVGRVFLAEGDPSRPLPEDAILVCRTAPPDHARLMGKVKGIITDIGSVTCHLASVAREFGVPALFDTGEATVRLPDGESITLVADRATVYQGIIPELAEAACPLKRPIARSPWDRRIQAFFDKVVPLNLTDPQDPSFSLKGCRTIHDIIRFAHEMVLKEMFGLSEESADRVASVRLITDIPLSLHLIDLGGGLKAGLTTRDKITQNHLESIPLKALWKGFCHPGVTWSGAIAASGKDLMRLMAQGFMTGPNNLPGGDSYAILSREYLNLSAKFGYHYAHLDAFCSDIPDQNYVSLQFAGGIGPYYGKSLRLNFVGNVLFILGFKIKVTGGDLLEASLTGYDTEAMEITLDQVGRLLASSRLLDMAIASEAEVKRLVEAFFQGEYNFLDKAQEGRIEGFYTYEGNWQRLPDERLLQDGSEYGSSISMTLARMMGPQYQELLESIEAYYYFPLAIAKEKEISEGAIRVRVKPEAGSIDRAGGLAFGIRNRSNYFVMRIDALKNNVVLFEYINNRRFQRTAIHQKIETGRWYLLSAEISGNTMRGYLDEELFIEYSADRPMAGYAGLWTKADSVAYFDQLSIKPGSLEWTRSKRSERPSSALESLLGDLKPAIATLLEED